MRMNWYYRMILSYTPIFFVVISTMIFTFFLVLNNASENKYIETNQAILKRMIYNVDANFMLIERNVASELLRNSAIQHYFSDSPKTAYDDFVLQEKLIELKSSLPFLNTVYIYNEAEKRIISDVGSYILDSFGDKEFLLSNIVSAHSDSWHDPRLFAYTESDENKLNVFSLMKAYRDGNELKGALVVNVYQHSFLDYLNSFNESDSNTVRLLDHDIPVYDTETATVMVKSDYTGWTFISEGVNDKGFNTLSYFSSAWMIILAIIIVMALIGFIFVTHMHYKPIQSIMKKAGYFSNRKNEELGITNTNNEFTFIEMALDQLQKRSLDYESIYKEESLLRQQRLFHDLIMGHQVYSDEQFKMALAEFELPNEYDRLGVIIVEIDNYAAFTTKYKPRDQHLLKFIVENAFVDLGQQNNTYVWRVWMEPHRIAFVMHHVAADHGRIKSIKEFAEQFQNWINDNLELTVTIGVGVDAISVAMISDSFRNAEDNIGLKAIFGSNTLIDNEKSAGKKSLDNYVYLKALESIAQCFKMNERDWQEKLTLVFEELKKMRFMKRDIALFMSSFVQQIDIAIASLSANIQNIWNSDYKQRFSELHLKVETLDELEEQLMNIMNALEIALEEERQARRSHSIALQAKNYIDEHYADPNLSLSRVSDVLKLQPSSLSQLFKEEMGEKFIDYVLKIRLLHAKKLLKDTDDSIQSIAEQVGYQNVISFYRAFKKVEDIPPGEYRNIVRKRTS